MTLSHHPHQHQHGQEQGTSSLPPFAQQPPAHVPVSSSQALLAGIAQPCSTPDVKGKKRESSLDWLPPSSTSASTGQETAEAEGGMQSLIHAAQQQLQTQGQIGGSSSLHEYTQRQQQEALTAAAEAAAMQQAFAAATGSILPGQVEAGASSLPAGGVAQSNLTNGSNSNSIIANPASFTAPAPIPSALTSSLLPPEVSTNPASSSSTPSPLSWAS